METPKKEAFQVNMELKEINQLTADHKVPREDMKRMIAIQGDNQNKKKREGLAWTIVGVTERPLKTSKEGVNVQDQKNGIEEGKILILDQEDDLIVETDVREAKVEEDRALEKDDAGRDPVAVNTGMVDGMTIDETTEDAMDMTTEEMEGSGNKIVWKEENEKESEKGKEIEVEIEIRGEIGAIEMIELTLMNGLQNRRMRKILGCHP